MRDEFDWDFEKDPEFDSKAYEESIKRYNEPRATHECGMFCKGTVVANYHDIEDIFDDFTLSSRKREVQFMEIQAARGREHKERMLLRRFQSTEDGSYVLRMETVSQLTKERIGDLKFETLEDADAYYNWAIDTFGFNKALKIGPDDDPDGLFDDDEGLFDTDEDDLFDMDEDDDDLFGPDEDEGLFD